MTTLRGPGEKSVGKPDAGNRHVRFDERGRETGLLAPRPSSTLPTASANEEVSNPVAQAFVPGSENAEPPSTLNPKSEIRNPPRYNEK